MGFLYRPHRELLAEAMAEVVTLENWDALAAHVAPKRLVSVEKHGGFDDRIGWDTHIVMVEWENGTTSPIGFTNAPVPRPVLPFRSACPCECHTPNVRYKHASGVCCLPDPTPDYYAAETWEQQIARLRQLVANNNEVIALNGGRRRLDDDAPYQPFMHGDHLALAELLRRWDTLLGVCVQVLIEMGEDVGDTEDLARKFGDLLANGAEAQGPKPS